MEAEDILAADVSHDEPEPLPGFLAPPPLPTKELEVPESGAVCAETARFLAPISQTLKRIAETARLTFRGDRMVIGALDASHVMRLQVELPRRAWIEYHLSGPPFSIGVPTAELHRIVHAADEFDPGSQVTLGHDRDVPGLLTVRISTEAEVCYSLAMSGSDPELDEDVEVGDHPVPEGGALLTAHSSWLTARLKELSWVSDVLGITATREQVSLTAYDTGLHQAASTTAKATLLDLRLAEGTERATERYTAAYLQDLTGLRKLSSNVTLSWAQEQDLHVEYLMRGPSHAHAWISARSEQLDDVMMGVPQ